MTTPDRDTLLAETRAFNAELERLLATVPPVHTLPAGAEPAERREGRGIFPRRCMCPRRARSRSAAPAGRSGCASSPPSGQPRGTFLHIHGGGWTLGEADVQDLRLERLARNTGLTVVSVGLPARARESLSGRARRLRGRGVVAAERPGLRRRRSAASGPLAIGGDSAGGQLLRLHAAAAARPSRDHRRVRRGRAPVRRLRPVDDTEPAAVGRAQPGAVGADHGLVRRPVPSRPGPRAAPGPGHLAAVRRSGGHAAGDLHGRHADPLLDDSLFMEARWRAAGHATELRVWPEAPHGFVSLPMTVADAGACRRARLPEPHARLRLTGRPRGRSAS